MQSKLPFQASKIGTKGGSKPPLVLSSISRTTKIDATANRLEELLEVFSAFEPTDVQVVSREQQGSDDDDFFRELTRRTNGRN